MFKKCFELYKNDIKGLSELDGPIFFQEDVQENINGQLDIITYTEDVVKKKNDEAQRQHFFYLLEYNDGEGPTYWFEAINIIGKKEFLNYILEDVESNYIRPFSFIGECKLQDWDRAKDFRLWLDKYYFDRNASLTKDYYVNLQLSAPTYSIYNALGELQEDLCEIVKKKKEELELKITDYILLQPLPLKIMCWCLLSTEIHQSFQKQIFL